MSGTPQLHDVRIQWGSSLAGVANKSFPSGLAGAAADGSHGFSKPRSHQATDRDVIGCNGSRRLRESAVSYQAMVRHENEGLRPEDTRFGDDNL
jgi:hypothetical protein